MPEIMRKKNTRFPEIKWRVTIRTRHGPTNNALFNNLALAIILQSGYPNLAEATDDYQTNRYQRLRAVTKTTTFKRPKKRPKKSGTDLPDYQRFLPANSVVELIV